MGDTVATLKIANFSGPPLFDSAAAHLAAGRLTQARAELEGEVSLSSGRVRLEAVLMLAKVEIAAGDSARVLALLEEWRHAFDADGGERVLAWFHMTRAAARQINAERTGSQEEAGSAFIDYEQAAYHLLRGGDWQEAGHALNNMALMQHRAGRREEAREHLEHARACFSDLPAKLAQVDASEAGMFMAEGDRRAARKLALRAAAVFAEHDKDRLLDNLLPVLLWSLAGCDSEER